MNNGKTQTINVNLEGTVSALKNKISEATSISAAEQKLIFKDVILVDSKTLKECGIKSNDIITVVFALI